MALESFFQSRNLSRLEVTEGRKARSLSSLRESIIWGALLWSVPSSSPARTTNRFQIATVVSLLYGLSSQKIVWQPILLSFFLLLLFVTTEIYVAQDPIIPVTVLKSRGVLLACVAQLGIMVARWMVLFYTPYVSFSLSFLISRPLSFQEDWSVQHKFTISQWLQSIVLYSTII